MILSARPIVIEAAIRGTHPNTVYRDVDSPEHEGDVVTALAPEILLTCRTVWNEAAPML